MTNSLWAAILCSAGLLSLAAQVQCTEGYVTSAVWPRHNKHGLPSLSSRRKQRHGTFGTPRSCVGASATLAMTGSARASLSTMAGWAIIAGSTCLKVPQIVRIAAAKSVLGLATVGVYADVLVYTCSVLYNSKHRYPFQAYGENVAIVAQNIACVLLMWKYMDKPPPKRTMWAMGLGYLGACAAIFLHLPLRFCPLLIALNGPLVMTVNVPQILANAKQGHTGELAAGTVAMKFMGSAIRLFTTLHDIGFDFWLLGNYFLGASLNAILLVQLWWYREATQAARRRDQVPLNKGIDQTQVAPSR